MKKTILAAGLALLLLAGCHTEQGRLPDGVETLDPAPDAQVEPVAPGEQTQGTAVPDELPADEVALTTAAAEMTGRIVRVHESGGFLIAGEERAELYEVSGGLPVFDADGNARSAAPEVGMLVSVGFSGGIMETYPARLGSCGYVRVCSEPDDRVGLYLTALRDLWNTDEGLNSGVSCLAFDLTGAENLSAGEKEALVYLAECEYGLWAITGTFDELCEAGEIDRDAPYYENGLLIELTVTEYDETSAVFDLSKWRSGDGAYFFSDCTAKLENGRWSYAVGAEMIS